MGMKDRLPHLLGGNAPQKLPHASMVASLIYCEMVGYGATCNAHHITTPAPEGPGLAEMAIAQAGVSKEEINHVNAHGTSTACNDKFETMAIKSVLGDHAQSDKLGHTLGAGGGLEQ